MFVGFDSNLIPNFNILLFQPYPGEDSEYSGQSERFACISAFSLGNNQIIGKFILTGSIFYRIQQGSLQIPNTSIIRWDSERKTRIVGKFITRSSEMAKIAIPAQEISENWKIAVFLHADREN